VEIIVFCVGVAAAAVDDDDRTLLNWPGGQPSGAGQRLGDPGKLFGRKEQETVLGEEWATARLLDRFEQALVGGELVGEFGSDRAPRPDGPRR
jgi:hypothetical protein